ncbi:MAG: alanine racemase [Candidatus Aminicenantes bacterium RBG_19FT_COMBO_58_17]|nr:MAG: alanine racemase [Candidatus Aminicenantes bacterium RBG_19FT_COMBO_58_17]
MRRRNFLQAMGAGSLAALSSAELGTPRHMTSPDCPKDGESTRIPPLSANQEEQPAAGPGGYHDPRIAVNLAHIRWNLSQIRNHVKVPVMAVVKANAYGHGLVGTSKALEKAGADSLMVGKLQEAVALREAGIRCPILNFGPFDRRDSAEIIQRKISQSVFTEEVAYLDEAAAGLDKTASVHIDIDTGMGRTGAAPEQALRIIKKTASFPHLKIDGVCTTLTEEPDFDKEQLRRFLQVCTGARAKGISLGLRHAASSAGIFYSSEFYLDMIRPGITLYGYYPNAGTRKTDALGLKPVLKLSARVSFIKDLGAGEPFSYLRAFKAESKMRLATIGIGYSDGYPFLFSGKVQVLIRNKKFPVLGAITSNHVMVGLGDDREVRIGDEVTLIDPDRSSGLAADDLAGPSGVADYKILIGLNPLIPRTYLG